MASIFDSFRSVPYLGDTIDEISGKKGLDTAAQGAREAQKQANYLSDLQWQRQMQGLQEARGQTQPYLSLLDKMYGTQMAGHVAPVGGLGVGGPRGMGGMSGIGEPGGGGGPGQPVGLLGPDGTRHAPATGGGLAFGLAQYASQANRPPIMRGSPPAQGPTPPPSPPQGMVPLQQSTGPSLQQLLENMIGPRRMG